MDSLTVMAGPTGREAQRPELTAELAACLERFLDATADEVTLTRARRALDAWRAERSYRRAPTGPVA